MHEHATTVIRKGKFKFSQDIGKNCFTNKEVNEWSNLNKYIDDPNKIKSFK